MRNLHVLYLLDLYRLTTGKRYCLNRRSARSEQTNRQDSDRSHLEVPGRPTPWKVSSKSSWSLYAAILATSGCMASGGRGSRGCCKEACFRSEKKNRKQNKKNCWISIDLITFPIEKIVHCLHIGVNEDMTLRLDFKVKLVSNRKLNCFLGESWSLSELGIFCLDSFCPEAYNCWNIVYELLIGVHFDKIGIEQTRPSWK